MAIDLERLRKNYAEFEDYKIEQLAKNEIDELEPDVVTVLMYEINKRGLNPGLVEGIKAQTKELTEEELDILQIRIRNLPCPECGQKTSQLLGAYIRTVVSIIFVTSYKNVPVIACKSCVSKRRRKATILTALFGWWGFPFGIFRTPYALITTLSERKSPYGTSANIITDFVGNNVGEIRTHWENEDELVDFIRHRNNV